MPVSDFLSRTYPESVTREEAVGLVDLPGVFSRTVPILLLLVAVLFDEVCLALEVLASGNFMYGAFSRACR